MTPPFAIIVTSTNVIPIGYERPAPVITEADRIRSDVEGRQWYEAFRQVAVSFRDALETVRG